MIEPTETAAQRIAVNAYRTDRALVVVAPMPGVMPDDVEIRLAHGNLHLNAELRTAAPKDYVIHEWDYGLYERILEVGSQYGAPITATLGNGQLAVSLTAGGPTDEPVLVHPKAAGAE